MPSTNLELLTFQQHQLHLELIQADNEKLRSLIDRTQAETRRIRAETTLEIEKGTATALQAAIAQQQLNTDLHLAKIRYGISFHEIPPIPFVLEEIKSG